MKAAIAILLVLLAVPASAEKMIIPDDVVAACEEAGGCVLIRKDILEKEIYAIYKKGVEDGAAEAKKDSRSCRRDSV